MIEPRSRFDAILRKYGHDIYLQRRTVQHGTGQYDTMENEGFSKSLERHTVRDRIAGRSNSLAQVQEEQMEGIVASVDRVFYFRWDVNPNKRDRIYDLKPNGRELYLLDWAEPLRGYAGHIIYWATGGTLEDPN